MNRQLTLGTLSALALTLMSGAAFAQDTAEFQAALAKGPLYLALAAYGFGFLVSLTPCVYPMVAITVSVFGANKANSRLQAVGLSAMFVLGLAALFVPFGVVAAMTGKTFGAALASPWVVVVLSAFFLALAASMFGAFELDLPAGLKNKLASVGGGGYAGAFVLGLACGPIAAPCTGPFLSGLLAWIANTQSVMLGTIAMSTFAFGLGTPFFLVGAFALQLPKSGRWMVSVKSLMGILLVIVAFYFLGNAFPVLKDWASHNAAWFEFAAAGAIVLGIILGAIHKNFSSEEWGVSLQKGSGIALVCVATFAIITSRLTPSSTLSWEKPAAGEDIKGLLERATQQAKVAGKPVLIDFGASWCVACKEIETVTFPDPRVQEAAGNFVAVKVDMSDDDDPALEDIGTRYAVRGLPTLILINPDGKEVKRFADFVTADTLAAAMTAIQ